MPLTAPRHLRKALAYITHNNHLLVFIHVAMPEAGIQVPGGTVENGESAEQTVLREAIEETGFADLKVVALLGTVDYDMSAYGKNEIHHRSFFHLEAGKWNSPRWQQWETSGGKGRSKLFELFWVPLPNGVPDLIAGHGDFIHCLSRQRKA